MRYEHIRKEGRETSSEIGNPSKSAGETFQVKNIREEADIIAERAKDLDLTLRETPYKIMCSKKMKLLNEKVKTRTITKEEWQQLMWNKKVNIF